MRCDAQRLPGAAVQHRATAGRTVQRFRRPLAAQRRHRRSAHLRLRHWLAAGVHYLDERARPPGGTLTWVVINTAASPLPPALASTSPLHHGASLGGTCLIASVNGVSYQACFTSGASNVTVTQGGSTTIGSGGSTTGGYPAQRVGAL